MTPDTLEATAARYDRWYGTKPGDGGTSDQMRAGAQAMRMVAAPERYGRRKVSRMLLEWNVLRSAIATGDPEASQAAFDACEEWIDFAFGRAAEAKLAAIEETTK